MKLAQFVAKFQQAKPLGKGYLVRCPAHDDNKSSLSICEGDNGGVLIYCHAGCATTDIVAALGMKMADLMPPKPSARPTITDIYDYTDVGGTLLYQVCRKSDKTFLQRRPDGAGGWIWKTGKAVKRVPYRLPELVNRPTVFVVEGEKDVNRLWSVGVPATCNAGGAGKWGATESKMLKEVGVTRVVILPDNDGPGIAHAHEVAGRCRAKGLAVTILQLPGLKEHGDVSDWLDEPDNTADDLWNLVTTTPYVVPTAPAQGDLPAAGNPEPPPIDVHTAAQTATIDDPDALPDPTKYAPPGSDGTPFDVGAAEAFRDRFGDRVRYDHSRGIWLIWHDHFWRPDEDGEIFRLAKRHVDLWQQEAIKAVTYPNRRALVNFTLKLDKRSALENMLTLATKEKPISTSGSQWDSNLWVLGVPNGVVDLRTGQLRAGVREDWITKQAGAVFDPNATCPRWEQFLREIMCDDEEMIDYLWRAMGYSLTGDMREQCFFVAIGNGANGKSILLDTLEHVWGSYGHRANMRIFVSNRDDEKFHLAELAGRRLVFAAETKPGQRMNEHVVKNFTGGESQSAERKFGQPFTFKPIGKLWLGVNHHPRVADDSYGFWRRIRLIEFEQTFTGTREDRTLKETLRDEAPGILAWAVRGCLEWQQRGLVPPAKVAAAVDEYQVQEDPLNDFFHERLEPNPDAVTSFRAIYTAYVNWAKESGMSSRDVLSPRGMGVRLKAKFQSADLNGQKRYRGVEIKAAHVPAGMWDAEHSGD